MRYDCDEPAFAGDYVEFSDSFSRAQQRALWDAAGVDEEAFLELLRPKILSCRLTCVDAEAITLASELTTERLDQVDSRLYTWFSYAWVAHLRGLTDLGNAIGRKLLNISVSRNGTEKETVSAL